VGCRGPLDLELRRLGSLDPGDPDWAGLALNRDFLPLLEYGTALAIRLSTVPENLRYLSATFTKTSPDPAFPLKMLEGHALRWESNLRGALALYAAALRLRPDSGEAATSWQRTQISLAGSMARNLDSRGVLGLYQEAEAMGLRDFALLLAGWGALLNEAGLKAQAEAALERSLRVWPRNPFAWKTLDDCRTWLGDAQGTAEAYGQSAHFLPGFPAFTGRAAERGPGAP
jgi:tetratricopeptide (TPR) repeat protein